MSRAFVKEADGSEGGELPELQVSPHRNLVTPAGMRQIEETVGGLTSELSAARAAEDRARIARIQRDLRYWTARQGSAEVVDPPAGSAAVRFGSAVTLEKAAGARIEYRIVGEDEADPARGSISYVSPIARLLIGAATGDVVQLADGEATIRRIA